MPIKPTAVLHTDSPTSPTPGLTAKTHPSVKTHASTERPPTTTNKFSSRKVAAAAVASPETLLSPMQARRKRCCLRCSLADADIDMDQPSDIKPES
ncbi:hypothetical protein Tco_0239853 [Tanacetum coccineum]